MYLKKLEICGFKSFADKTILEFEPGISGIIGPNGCGKSNISDSIRWCLGEQRAKSMRSSNMQEVIFGGTQTRATTGMAEVSLTFDNSQNVLPINYSEVTVTRRLFRSGESEYFINKAQCRLKDIRDMFLDTGIGSDGYSVIEQGRIDFLTTAKPEDRRELFEETAGVSKYKVRREETLKRLEKIDIDMSRLSDALAIHKQQVTALDIAAEKAKQYKKYQEDLLKYEAASLVSQISFGSSEISRLRTELEPKIKDFESANTLMNRLDADIQEMRLSLDTKNESYLNMNKELAEIKMQIGMSDQIIQHAVQRETEIRSEIEVLKQELAANEEKIVSIDEQLKTLNSNSSSLSDNLAGYETDYKDKEHKYSLVKSRLSDLEIKRNELKEKILHLGAKKECCLNSRAEVSENRIHLDAEIASLQRIVFRLKDDLGPARLEVSNMEAGLISADVSLSAFEAKKNEIDNIILANEEKCRVLENTLVEYKKSLASSDSRMATLMEFDQKDPVRSSIRAVLAFNNSIRGPLSSLIDISADKQELIASVLGGKLNYLVCGTPQEADQAVKFLEENGLSRLSFIVSDKIPDTDQNFAAGRLPQGYAELIKYLKYDSSYEKIIRYICSGMLVCGNKVYGDVVVSGGGKIFFEKPVLIEEQIQHIKNKLEELKLRISVTESEIKQIEENQINLRLKREKESFDIIKIKTQIESNHSQLQEKKDNIKNTADEINRHEEEIKLKTKELNSFNDKLSVFEAEFAETEDEENILCRELKSIEDDISVIRKEEEILSPLMMEARSLWDKKTAEFESKRSGRQYLLDNISALKKHVEYTENKIDENDDKISDLLSSQEAETVKIQQLYESQTQKESEIQFFLNDKQSVQDTLASKINEFGGLRTRVEGLNSQINAIQLNLKNLEYQKADLGNRLAETYGMTYEEAENDFKGLEVNHEEIAKIKRKIEVLGSVNLSAQEEYDALNEKYNFLLSQQQDLLKAKNDLLEVIRKINQSTIENFKKTFDAVRDNFKIIYKKLFGGGEADLTLTDETNLLESGVDIYAQPPGKKLQNISLCSGGEKVLTAVALLFAFFMVKPSPFCILDEVDAPLDDANVGRYNAMIKEFSLNTQFLVVTHNKRTMEIVDILYGVTMEEHGISKIISVKMNKQDELDPSVREA